MGKDIRSLSIGGQIWSNDNDYMCDNHKSACICLFHDQHIKVYKSNAYCHLFKTEQDLHLDKQQFGVKFCNAINILSYIW